MRLALPLAMLALGRVVAAQETRILIVAGQSNVLNWHAAAAELPAAETDASIPFFFVTGAPPGRGFATPENSTSGDRWTTLGPQRQEPYVRYEREFFGPEVTLARELGRDGPVAVVKVAFFGTSLAQHWNPADPAAGLYARLIDVCRRARDRLPAGTHPRFAGFFWMQGETDADTLEHAQAYGAHLGQFVRRLRADLAAPDLPVVVARIGPTPPTRYPHTPLVRAAQERAAEIAPPAVWVDTDDLPRNTDGVHLLAAGVRELGRRWAEAWRTLARCPRESSTPPSPSPTTPSS